MELCSLKRNLDLFPTYPRVKKTLFLKSFTLITIKIRKTFDYFLSMNERSLETLPFKILFRLFRYDFRFPKYRPIIFYPLVFLSLSSPLFIYSKLWTYNSRKNNRIISKNKKEIWIIESRTHNFLSFTNT